MKHGESIEDLVEEYQNWSDDDLIDIYHDSREYTDDILEAVRIVAAQREIVLPSIKEDGNLEGEALNHKYEWPHIPLGIFGLYNAYLLVTGYISMWEGLHQKGISHTYLIISNFIGSWWLITAFKLCFSGNKAISKYGGKPIHKLLLAVLIGAAISYIVPSLMTIAFYVIIGLMHTLLFS